MTSNVYLDARRRRAAKVRLAELIALRRADRPVPPAIPPTSGRRRDR